MNIAIVGYGKMGKAIEEVATQSGHRIVIAIDIHNEEELRGEKIKKADVAIEFSTPETAYNNILACFQAGIPVVSGTTGWLDKMSDLERHIQKGNHTFFYASNFSLGVNILFLLNRKLANIMNGFRDYTVSINETHHTQKVDAPSGTAISLANDVIQEIARLTGWAMQGNQASDEIPISSHRKGSIPGDHIVKYESSHDIIELKHSAKTRIGFASGALLAAEYIQGKRGKYTMRDLLPL